MARTELFLFFQATGGIYEELGDDRLNFGGGGLTPTPTTASGAAAVRGGGESYYPTGPAANYAGQIVVARQGPQVI